MAPAIVAVFPDKIASMITFRYLGSKPLSSRSLTNKWTVDYNIDKNYRFVFIYKAITTKAPDNQKDTECTMIAKQQQF